MLPLLARLSSGHFEPATTADEERSETKIPFPLQLHFKKLFIFPNILC